MNLLNSYHQLGESFYRVQPPTAVAQPVLIRINEALAEALDIDKDWLHSAAALATFAGNALPQSATPIATAYAGHQFGSWNPQLGDGRAILLGEMRAKDGRLYDVQLKGAGPTPFSRMGDGRSPLGPVLREYVVSEAMAALGIPTTRALAAVTTGESVYRQFPLPGAILTRVAQSHIRVGTFQFFAARQDLASVKALADYVIERHFKTAVAEEFADEPYVGLLSCVVRAQAELIARWLSVGFIHGVMNTDNMLICGETVDYGPCAFMDGFDPEKVYSSIDDYGRYAYRNQPAIAHWNLGRFAEALLPLIDADQDTAIKKAEGVLEEFFVVSESAYAAVMANKLGFETPSENTKLLTEQLLARMADERADFTLTYRALGDELATRSGLSGVANDGCYELPNSFEPWLTAWLDVLAETGTDPSDVHHRMTTTNPAFIPRNHLVEKAIEHATRSGDFTLFHQLVDRLARPFDFDPADKAFALGPGSGEEVLQTFCGT